MSERRRDKKVWLCLGVVAVLLAAVIVLLVLNNNGGGADSDVQENENSGVIAEKTETGVEANAESTDNEKVKEEVVQYDGEDPNESEDITGVITYAAVSGDNLLVRVNIDQYLNSGSCELIISKSGEEVYTDTAEVVDSAATSTCEGFNVPLSALPKGELAISVRLDADQKQGNITGEVTINT